MASSAFKAALANTKATKNMDQVLVGNGSNFLGEGGHDVTITAIGPATDRDGNAAENQQAITYAGEGDKVYNDRLFLTNTDGTELSYGVRQLLSALIPDTMLLEQWFDIAVSDDHALEMFTGMKCRIELGYRGGKDGNSFQIRSTGAGGFAAYIIDSKGKIGEKVTEDHADIADAKNDAKAQGYKQAFLRIVGMTCTHAESNAAAFATAVAGRSKPKAGVRVSKAV
jgi:hypothetical protein